jgi:hypothetical protein
MIGKLLGYFRSLMNPPPCELEIRLRAILARLEADEIDPE